MNHQKKVWVGDHSSILISSSVCESGANVAKTGPSLPQQPSQGMHRAHNQLSLLFAILVIASVPATTTWIS